MITAVVVLGILLVIVGLVRHFILRGAMPHIGYQLIRLDSVPGYIIAGIGVIFVILGLVL